MGLEKTWGRLPYDLARHLLLVGTARNFSMKTASSPVLRSTHLLDQVRERICCKHYSLRAEKTYAQWVRWLVRWHGLQHPRNIGKPEIEVFATCSRMNGTLPSTQPGFERALSPTFDLSTPTTGLERSVLKSENRFCVLRRQPGNFPIQSRAAHS